MYYDLRTRERQNDLDLLDSLFDACLYGNNVQTTKLMSTDIEENDKEFVLNVDLPGVNKEDVKLSLNEGYLNISLNKTHKEEETKKNFIRKERVVNKVERSFYLGDVDKDKITASLENGVLNIIVPKLTKEEESKFIEIK